MPFAQKIFDVVAQLATNAIQTARDAGFVLGEFTADFRESLLLDVVEAKALAVKRVQQCEGYLDGAGEDRQVSLAMGIGGCRCAKSVAGVPVVHGDRAVLVFGQLGQAGAGAKSVYMALGEDGAKPSLQGAASVEIAEQGAVRALSVGQAVKIGEKRVRQFVSVWGSWRAAENRAGGGSEVRLVSCNEEIPGGNVALSAGGRESKVLKMQGREIFLQSGGGGFASKGFLGATGEGCGKVLGRKAPQGGLGLRKQMIYQWFTAGEALGTRCGRRTLFPFAHQVHTVWAVYATPDSILEDNPGDGDRCGKTRAAGDKFCEISTPIATPTPQLELLHRVCERG
jgi:hypothetical protein